jgi:hypothetical protein
MELVGTTLEELGDALFDRREEIRRLDAEKSAIQAEFDEIEFVMIGKLTDAGLTSAGISRCTFSLKQEQYPQVKDLNAFVKWAADNDRAEMLQKRVSAAVFREYYEQNNEMPEGIETYDKLTLSMRKR